ncbi:MAG: hypothetical protein R6V27_08800 [Balneolaceae bacterium]
MYNRSLSMVDEIFLSLFAITFIVALIAFSLYGYLLVQLLKHHSEKYNPKTAGEFLLFLWQLLVFYIHRAMSGTLGINKGDKLSFIENHDRDVRRAEAEQKKLLKVYRLFSAAYLLFFFLILSLMVTLIYMVAGPYL